MSAWQPIETVPKDGTPVDLWGIVSDDYDEPRSERWTDARWVFGRWVGPWSDGFESGLPDDCFTPTHWAYPPLGPATSPPQPDALKLAEEALLPFTGVPYSRNTFNRALLSDDDFRRAREAFAAIRAAREGAAHG